MIKNNHYQDSEYHYLKLKVDFYERSNRILHAYLEIEIHYENACRAIIQDIELSCVYCIISGRPENIVWIPVPICRRILR